MDRPEWMPDQYYNVIFIDGSFEQIDHEACYKIQQAIDERKTFVTVEPLIGGHMIIVVKQVIGFALITEDVVKRNVEIEEYWRTVKKDYKRKLTGNFDDDE